RIFCFFSACGCLAPAAHGLVFCRDCRLTAQTLRGCPTPVLRCHRRRRDEGRDASVACAATEPLLGALLPASAQSGLHAARCPVRTRRGGGAPPGGRWRRAP